MEELSFTDLAVLEKIDENTVVEKFGSRINASFFDAANILGTLKQKGLIDFKSQFPGPSEVFLTEKGKGIMALAKEKAAQELDKLDDIILTTVANGYKDPKRIEEKINIRSSDLAYHLNRLTVQNYLSYNFRSGKIEFMLTEDGFKHAGYPQPPSEEELKKEAADIEDIIKTSPAAQGAPVPLKPMKMDKQARMMAKAEYYSKSAVRYAIIAIALIIIMAAAAYYWLYLR